jgi:hypothetical protein
LKQSKRRANPKSVTAQRQLPRQQPPIDRWLIPLLVAVMAAITIYRSPWFASTLDVYPDSQEMVIGAQRLVLLGSYSIEIEGVTYPPRYPPWFSVLILAPFYAMAPHELGIGIIPVQIIALAAVMGAYALAARISGEWGGALAALLLLFTGDFLYHAKVILTDVPAAASLLALTLVLPRLRRGDEKLRWCWLAGVLAAVAGALRVLAFASVLPLIAYVLLSQRRMGPRLLAITLPSTLIILLTALYNHHTFGDWRRTGYHFWTPIPYDVPGMTFSAGFLWENVRGLAGLWAVFLAGAIGAVAIWLWARGAARPDAPPPNERAHEQIAAITAMLLLAAVPISLVHLFYFYEQTRFHLPAATLLCVIGGAGIALLVPEMIRRYRVLLTLGLVVAAAHGHVQLQQFVIPPLRRIAAEHMANTEPNAVIVTAIDPVYLEPLVLRNSQRRIIPYSREVEYASKLVAPEKIGRLDPPPTSPFEHRHPALLAAGAREVVAVTAAENPEVIVELKRQGVPVYLDMSMLPPTSESARRVAAQFRELGLPMELPERRKW